MSSNPIFVGGYFKSGTSLLRALLGQHPDIASGLETHWFAIDPAAGIGRGGETLSAHVERLAAFFDLDPAMIRDRTRNATTGEAFLDAVMALHVSAQGKSRWAEKTPDNLCHTDRIFAHWPDSRFVHILRDPRDVYVSMKECGKGGDPARFGDAWAAWICGGEAAAQRAGDGHFHTLLYADLVNTPEPVMRALASFLNVSWHPSPARFDGKGDEYETVLRLTGKKSTTLESLAKPLFTDRVGIWVDRLDADEIELLESALREAGGWAAYRRLCDINQIGRFAATG